MAKNTAATLDKFLAVQAKSKALFRQQCDLKAELIEMCGNGRCAVGDGRTLTRVDNFAGRFTAFKTVGFDRYDLAIEGEVEAPKVEAPKVEITAASIDIVHSQSAAASSPA